MQVHCPHCKRSFVIELRKGNYASAKANKARRLNSKLGGRPAKLTNDLLREIYLSIAVKGTCSGDQFSEAIEKATGIVYSRSRVFFMLKQFKTKFPNPLTSTPLGTWLIKEMGHSTLEDAKRTDRCIFVNDKSMKPKARAIKNKVNSKA